MHNKSAFVQAMVWSPTDDKPRIPTLVRHIHIQSTLCIIEYLNVLHKLDVVTNYVEENELDDY